MSDDQQWEGGNRRKLPRSHDTFYQIVIGLNVVAWVIFVICLIIFHYARPELVSGVQDYWGVSGREDWSYTLSFYLIVLLFICTFMNLCVMVMRRYRTRRKHDYFGINVVILLAISVTVLVWIISSV